MREIKFRAKRSYDKKWLYGSIVKIEGKYHLLENEDIEECGHHFRQVGDSPTWVNENTIGQFTGLTEKNGNEIYEGDILQIWLEDSVEPKGGFFHKMYVRFTKEKGYALWCNNMTIEDAEPLFEMLQWKDCDIIGNIHDNPELLTEK